RLFSLWNEVSHPRRVARAERTRVAHCYHLGNHPEHWSDEIHYPLSRHRMKFPLYSRVALAEDFPPENLRRGDIATIVEYYEGAAGQEPGYELEVFNAVGDT